MITYQVDSVEDVLNDLPKDTFSNHYEEVDYNTGVMELDPDFEYYYLLEEKGMIHPVTVRDDGKIVGYCVSFLCPHPHHKGKVLASNDIFYIHPDYRRTGIAAELLAFVEKDLIELGVSIISIAMKDKKPFKNLIESAGFGLEEIRYCKYIGNN